MRTELVTTLKRHAAELLSELEQSKEPILITQIAMLEGIARGERAVEEGRTLTHAQAVKRMKRWLR